MSRGKWLAAMLVSACAQTPVRSSEPGPVSEPTLPVETPSDDAGATSPVVDAATLPAAASDAAIAVAPVRSDPAVFRCGARMCRMGAETCCASGDEGVCMASLPDDAPKGKIGYLKSQWEACGKLQFTQSSSFDHLDRCDESVDCGKREICCEQFLFSGGTMNECTAPAATGATPCDFGEKCVEGSPCRLPGTVCTRGYCQKTGLGLRCGATTCSNDTPVCCGDSGCKASADCKDDARIACVKNADCISGQRCVMQGRSTACLRFVGDLEHTPFVCQRPGDCPNRCTTGRVRCEPSDVSFLKHCECP